MTLLQECFSGFLNGTNDTKWRKHHMLRMFTKAAFHSNNSMQVNKLRFLNVQKRVRLYLNEPKLSKKECNSFLFSKDIQSEIRSKITCRALDVVHYSKCNICNKTTTFIIKTVGDINIGFKSYFNLHALV